MNGPQDPAIELRPSSPLDPQVQALIQHHLAEMHEASPPGTVFALDTSGLSEPGVSLWGAWAGDRLAGVGALKQHNGTLGEIKSMRTHPAFLRRGVAQLLLTAIVAAARSRGLQQLSLETGRGPVFEAAIRLYERNGFVEGDRFADYPKNDFSRFFHLTL
ncbi:MAG: GNAT family N-acetyltransferase [Pseudomonadota bacterium]